MPAAAVLLPLATAAAAATTTSAPPPPAAAVGVQAFYILFADQIESSDWPARICQNGGRGPQGGECVAAAKYKNGVFVTSPQNITKELVAKVKADVPGSSVVAYWDFGDIPIVGRTKAECPFCTGHIMGDREGRNCTTTYHCGPSPFVTALQSAFPHELAVHDITDGAPGVMVEGYPGLARYIWNNRSAPLLAEFLSSWLADNGFDGIYLDGYMHFQTPKGGYVPANRSYDADGDGVADTSSEVAAMLFSWGPAFVAAMRSKLGPSALVLANSAGPLSDPSLSGVTIEMESCVGARGGVDGCADALGGQLAATRSAGRLPLSVLWLTHAESMPPAEQCAQVARLQQKYGGWLQAGTDFFDGSHIVC